MVKKFVLALVLSVAMSTSVWAADTGFYAGLKFIDSIQSSGSIARSGGANWFDIDNYTQNTIGGGIFVGWDFYPQNQIPLRAELEYAIRTNSSTEWDLKSSIGQGIIDGNCTSKWNLQTLFINGYYDFHNSTSFTPYIGAGLGIAFINSMYDVEINIPGSGSTSDNTGEANTVFAWNAGIGCSYAIAENISADLAYRFIGLGYTETEKSLAGQNFKVGIAPYANEFSLGIRFTF